jgi:hypothetical protein
MLSSRDNGAGRSASRTGWNVEREARWPRALCCVLAPPGRVGLYPPRLSDRALSDGGDLQPDFDPADIDAFSSHRGKSLKYKNDELTDREAIGQQRSLGTSVGMACQLVQRSLLFSGQLCSAHGIDDIVSAGDSSRWFPCDICYAAKNQFDRPVEAGHQTCSNSTDKGA